MTNPVIQVQGERMKTRIDFKAIDERADARRREESIRENRERARAARASGCSFRKHVNAMYHPGRCEHPDRTKMDGISSRLCLKGDCPLFR